MAKEVKLSQDDFYAARVFFNAALPLLKVIAENEPKYSQKFQGKSFVFQVSAKCDQVEGGVMGTHFVVEDGKWTTYIGKVHEAPDVEFACPDLKKFIIFFAGKGMPLPKIKGLTKLGILVPVLMTLLRMAGLLQATEIPKKPEDQEMLVRLYFYLLVTAMSQLNKAGHPAFKAVTEHSPDRCYALKVSGYPELQSYIRMKQGNTKAGRGEYPRCKPFLTMIFDTPEHALGILMSKEDMMDFMMKNYLIVDGAPEFAGVIGDLMFKVAYYALGQYLDAEKAAK